MTENNVTGALLIVFVLIGLSFGKPVEQDKNSPTEVFYFQKSETGDIRAAFNLNYKQDITYIYDARYEDCFAVSDLPLETHDKFEIIRGNYEDLKRQGVMLFSWTSHVMRDESIVPDEIKPFCQDKDITWLRRAESSVLSDRVKRSHSRFRNGFRTGVAIGVAGKAAVAVGW